MRSKRYERASAGRALHKTVANRHAAIDCREHRERAASGKLRHDHGVYQTVELAEKIHYDDGQREADKPPRRASLREVHGKSSFLFPGLVIS